jgi:hypothetical protein
MGHFPSTWHYSKFQSTKFSVLLNSKLVVSIYEYMRDRWWNYLDGMVSDGNTANGMATNENDASGSISNGIVVHGPSNACTPNSKIAYEELRDHHKWTLLIASQGPRAWPPDLLNLSYSCTRTSDWLLLLKLSNGHSWLPGLLNLSHCYVWPLDWLNLLQIVGNESGVHMVLIHEKR